MTLPQTFSERSLAVPRDSRAVIFPLEWVLATGSPPVQYRALRDVARLPNASSRFPAIILSHAPVLTLSLAQRPDGTWNGEMLTTPSRSDAFDTGVGSIAAVHRLLEFGLDADFPPLLSSKRVLFRLLAEDNDPAYLYEFAAEAGNAERRRHRRQWLWEAAAAALAHLGNENDPRLRGCANRMVSRVSVFLASPLALDPWERIGNKHVLSADASPPSISLLIMLARLPRYLQENHGFVEQLLTYLTPPAGRHAQRQVGGEIIPEPQLLLGDPLGARVGGDGELANTLFWLEVVSRLGLLHRHDGWASAFDRLLDERDRDGVWRPGRGRLPEASPLPEAWPTYPLDSRRDANAVAAEVTTRLGIIARAAGREIELA